MVGRLKKLLADAREARLASGKSLASQAAEIARLRFGRGRIGPGDYFAYRLFDDTIDWEGKRRFVGWRAEALVNTLNLRAWHAVANDKLVFAALMRSTGIPVPRTLAILHGGGRTFEGAVSFRRKAELANYFRNCGQYPLFSKPVAGGVGRGTALLRGLDAVTDSLLLGDGRSVGVVPFVDSLADPNALGHLVQGLIAPHPCVVALCGNRLCTARIMVVLGANGPQVHRSAWRIACGNNAIDNFSHGSLGNLVADIDPATGAVKRVISGYGLALKEAPRHPDTGAPLVGTTLPDWEDAVAMVCRGAAAMPGLRFQHWDVAFSNEGPIALEVNLYDTGGTDFSQLFGRGIVDGEVARLLGRR